MYIFEVVFVLAVILYVLAGSKDRYLYVLVFFLPFNAFIKSSLDFVGMDSRLFGFWKEILILMFFVGSINNILKYCRLKTISFILAIYIVLYFALGCTQDVSSAFVKLRDSLFPILLLITVSSRQYSPKAISNLLLIFSVSILITCIVGILESFGGYRPQIAIIKDAIVGIDPATGTIYYPAAWMIMGYNRMVGLLDSPNQLGVLLAIYLIVSYFFNGFIISKGKRRFMFLVDILAAICLVLTFSRTAFALLILTYIFYMVSNINNRKNFRRSIYIILGIAVIFGILLLVSQGLQDVVLGTATGQEASSADRQNNIMTGLEFAIKQPWGYGLGTTRSVNGVAKVFFVESGMVDLMIEQGVIGVILQTIYLYLIFKAIKKSRTDIKLKNFRSVLISTYICAWVSINPMEFIYSYYLMIFVGIVLSYKLSYTKNETISRL